MNTYIDKGEIGRGGFCTVFHCLREKDKMEFAKKMLRVIDEDNLRRFKREVRILASLDHPNLITIIEKSLTKEPYYYIMPIYKYSLASKLGEYHDNEEKIYPLFNSILDGVEYAHDQGVIHRDLKPENILLGSNSEIVVTDFGIGRIIDTESTRQTQAGYGMGTLSYMAPEQLRDAKNADERSDIFSLGRMLYELYTGPISTAIQDLSTLRSGIAYIVNKCTQTDPHKRFQSMDELKQAWKNMFETVSNENDLDTLKFLTTELSSVSTIDQDKIEQFLTLIVKFMDDEDLLHEVIMQLHPTALHAIYRNNSELCKKMLFEFVALTSRQSWAFSYTDKIANHCNEIFNVIGDFEIKATLTKCLLLVGYSHNRWNVFRVFARMIEVDKRNGEEDVFYEVLSTISKNKREEAVRHISVNLLHDKLKPLFTFKDI